MTYRLLALILMLSVAGCASDREPEGRDELNSLWRAGYGFNNPNKERRKQGLPPENFDGSVDEEEDWWPWGFVGDVLAGS